MCSVACVFPETRDARSVIFKRGERWPVGFAGLVSHPDLGTQFIHAGCGNQRKRPGVPTDSSIGQVDVPGMPPGELPFHVFGLAWHIHGISFVPMFEGKFSKLRGPEQSTCRARRLARDLAASVFHVIRGQRERQPGRMPLDYAMH